MLNNLINLNKEVWSKNSRQIIISILIYMGASIVGGILQQYQSSIPLNNPGYNWFNYFSHNINQSLWIILIGLISYGLGSFILLAINGFAMGIGIEIMVQNNRLDLIWSAFFPHAIFEIPAILLTTLFPFMLWRAIINVLKRRNIKELNKQLKYEILPTISLILLLFFIAAIMESQFTI